MTSEEIKAAIPRYPVALAGFSTKYDINIGVMMRNSNAFACDHFVIVGHKKYDRRPSMGVQNYEHIVHCESIEALRKFVRRENYTVIGVDYLPGVSVPMTGVEYYGERTLFVMGSERNGLPQEIINMCGLVVHIPMFGSVRSLNVGVASGIILNDWHEKYNG
jgi:tRNA G18 (ribose-2'-O)-methylase SpoU